PLHIHFHGRPDVRGHHSPRYRRVSTSGGASRRRDWSEAMMKKDLILRFEGEFERIQPVIDIISDEARRTGTVTEVMLKDVYPTEHTTTGDDRSKEDIYDQEVYP